MLGVLATTSTTTTTTMATTAKWMWPDGEGWRDRQRKCPIKHFITRTAHTNTNTLYKKLGDIVVLCIVFDVTEKAPPQIEFDLIII